jgi:cytochrome c oxidase assembly protein subunit 15
MKVWLYGNAGLTLAMIGVGGLTRLTESGLSITEWKPVTGSLPPLSRAAWEEELEKYRASPEYRRLRDPATFGMREFRRIYLWEWGHRALGRLIGLTYGLPWLYFVARGRIRGKLLLQTGALLCLGGAQGAVGWWMVKSGLEESLDHPRVNHVRLAVHLGSALTIYSSLMWLGMNATAASKPVAAVASSLLPRAIPVLLAASSVGAAAVFATAITGALVAGRDAGLIYNRTLVIPAEERARDHDARLQWRHRVAAVSTACGLLAIGLLGRRMPLPSKSRRLLTGLVMMTLVQTTLGVATLWSFVKVAVGSMHQLGSVLLLTASLHVVHDLRRLARFRV